MICPRCGMPTPDDKPHTFCGLVDNDSNHEAHKATENTNNTSNDAPPQEAGLRTPPFGTLYVGLAVVLVLMSFGPGYLSSYDKMFAGLFFGALICLAIEASAALPASQHPVVSLFGLLLKWLGLFILVGIPAVVLGILAHAVGGR